MDVLKTLAAKFWSEDIWLPLNVTWADRIATPENGYPNYNDLWSYPFALAALFTLIRFCILNPFVFYPLGTYLGLKTSTPRKVDPNPIAEKVFLKYKKGVPENILLEVSQELAWSERKLERWLRARSAMNRINVITKFIECAWQFVYYTFAFAFGVFALKDKIWLYDVNHFWIGYPNFRLDSEIWWYYMISLGFYWSMTFTHFIETRRKDFYQMFFHHLLTIALMVFSFTCNFTRVGSLVILVHDIADIPLQLSKMLIYAGWKKSCDVIFAIFAVMWIVTRCGYYPFWIVHNCLFDATKYVPMHPVYYIFSSLLTALAILHYYWTYFILRIILISAVTGEIKDERSSSEEEAVGEENFGKDVLKEE